MTYTLETLFATTHDQLFRLALLMTGSANAAAQLLVSTARMVPSQEAAPEAALIRALWQARTSYGRWEPGQAERIRAGLDRNQARALLHQLGRLTSGERMIVGLHYLRGLTVEEIAALLPDVSDIDETLSRLRVAAATTLGMTPSTADAATLIRIDFWLDGRLSEAEATDLRGLTFADAETRALRDGILAIRAQLPQILSGVFSVVAPPALLSQLLAAQAPARRKRTRIAATRPTAIGALVCGVLAMAALIIIVPGLRLQPAGSTAATSAPALLESALRRFERAPIEQGVLHERYIVRFENQPPLTIERWYDYAPPHRLAAEVRAAESGETNFVVRSDGRGAIEYQRPQAPDLAYQLTPDQAELATPVLRSILMPISFNSDGRVQPEISALYLAQARANNAVLAGRTNVGGREAFLLRYATDTLPTEQAAGQLRQVLLSIDAELRALLDVTVVAEGVGESVATTPWHAEQIEVLQAVPDSQFASTQGVVTTETLRSLSIPSIPEQLYSSLEVAMRERQQPLLAPTNLPETMRGFVLNQQRDNETSRFMLLYEGEFHSMLLFPGDDIPNRDTTWSEEFESGVYRYRTSSDFDGAPGNILAQVRRADTPQIQATVVLVDPLNPPAEREQRLRAIIASLEPITSQNLGAFPQFAVSADS